VRVGRSRFNRASFAFSNTLCEPRGKSSSGLLLLEAVWDYYFDPQAKCDRWFADSTFESMRQRAAGLGYRRVEEVGSDSGCRMHPEQQNENRRHKRAAAYSGQSDEHADSEAGHD
jgi:hypothetical protein